MQTIRVLERTGKFNPASVTESEPEQQANRLR